VPIFADRRQIIALAPLTVDVYGPDDEHMPTISATATGERKRKWVDSDGTAYDDAARWMVSSGVQSMTSMSAQPRSKPSARIHIGLCLRRANLPPPSSMTAVNQFARDGPDNKSLQESHSFFCKAEATKTEKLRLPVAKSPVVVGFLNACRGKKR
jgi:hypothetical protein